MWTFNKDEWREKVKDPLWYMDTPAIFKQLKKLHDIDKSAYEIEKEKAYDFFEEGLREGHIALSATGKNFDAERATIDTVVVHHTSVAGDLSKDRLSGMGLIRLYAPQYADPKYEEDREIRKRGIYSGHFRNGKQVFWPYHWIIRKDGTCERLLEDREVGWQAGNWIVNCRSVGIVFDADYEVITPPAQMLQSLADVIKKHYPTVQKENIIGHCEVNKNTTCPSKHFTEWKPILLGML